MSWSSSRDVSLLLKSVAQLWLKVMADGAKQLIDIDLACGDSKAKRWINIDDVPLGDIRGEKNYTALMWAWHCKKRDWRLENKESKYNPKDSSRVVIKLHSLLKKNFEWLQLNSLIRICEHETKKKEKTEKMKKQRRRREKKCWWTDHHDLETIVRRN